MCIQMSYLSGPIIHYSHCYQISDYASVAKWGPLSTQMKKWSQRTQSSPPVFLYDKYVFCCNRFFLVLVEVFWDSVFTTPAAKVSNIWITWWHLSRDLTAKLDRWRPWFPITICRDWVWMYWAICSKLFSTNLLELILHLFYILQFPNPPAAFDEHFGWHAPL